MRRSTIIIGSLAGVAVIFGGAVAGLSAASSGKIAHGVHVGGVELGGLTPDQAKDRIEREYVATLQRPIIVERRGQQYELSAKEARITADVDRTVADAVKASDTDNPLEHAWRTISGTKVSRSLDVQAQPSHDAVVRFVDRVRREVDRKPVGSTLEFDGDRPVVTKSKSGMAVDRKKLAELVTTAATDPQRQPILVPVEAEEPKESAKQIKKDHHTVIVVNRNEHKLFLYKDFKVSKKYGVAVGMQGLDTPAGTYTINDKQVNPSWHVPMSAWAGDLAGTVVPPGPTNPIKARWMGFFDGAGIHGTSDRGSIGSNASHGCVRMLEEDVIDLYDRVPVGTTIHVI
ncbi:MAG: L,D-transpeptidase [Solirubrobacteraceae bacterium]|nr:L,D-transpeptidase [Solirubrobacteraceae bacterium]